MCPFSYSTSILKYLLFKECWPLYIRWQTEPMIRPKSFFRSHGNDRRHRKIRKRKSAVLSTQSISLLVGQKFSRISKRHTISGIKKKTAWSAWNIPEVKTRQGKQSLEVTGCFDQKTPENLL